MNCSVRFIVVVYIFRNKSGGRERDWAAGGKMRDERTTQRTKLKHDATIVHT